MKAANPLPLGRTAFLRGLPDVSTKLRPRDSLARPGANYGPHPLFMWDPSNGMRRWPSSLPMKTRKDLSPLREDIAPDRWHPTPREYNHAISKLKRNKAADAGGVDNRNSSELH